jgi:hypothetical protein
MATADRKESACPLGGRRESESMGIRKKVAVLVLCFVALWATSCIGPGYGRFSDADAADHAVIALDVTHLEDPMKGEGFDVSALNAVSLDKFTDRRIERTSDGKLAKVFILVPPGRYHVTLRYCRNAMYFAGRDFWLADVTKEVVLAAGIYTVEGRVEGDFAFLWLADATGQAVTQPEKALIKKSERRVPPILIPI